MKFDMISKLITTFLTILYYFTHFAQCQSLNPHVTCGVLYSGSDFTGLQYPFVDQDQSVNLPEDYKFNDGGWNVTGSINIAPGCKMEICNDTYFDGNCKTKNQGSYSVNNNPAASVRCTCSRECKCSDVFIKKSSCARAYLKGGCNVCNPVYTDMNGTKKIFPLDFADKVTAFRLRKGCTLTVYEDEDFQGDDQVFDSDTVENFKGEIGSYFCECDDRKFIPKEKPPRPDTYPSLINIPKTLDEVLAKLNKQPGHPGLISAFKSLKRKRSGRNAYILLIGSTGSGKSSAINILFDNPNVTKVGGEKSTTTDIHEFRIPVAIDELGVANSELRVIDTPGLGDTRGVEQDAKFLASLDEYLTSHEELKDRLPNVVLIFHKFNDNRFDGVGSNFVKMLRGLDCFRERITDDKFSNVIFVLSHFTSVEKELQRRPDNRLNKFKEVIETYSLFPKPIMIAVAENKAREQEIPMVNGYFRLPNREYYPKNLFEKMELVTKASEDLMGLGVFRTAFRDSEDFNVTSKTFELVSEKSSKVPIYLNVITNAIFNVNNTEISSMLDEANERMDSTFKRQFPDSLPYLKKALNIRKIFSKDDIPKTTTTILELLTAIKKNDATMFLMEKAFDMRAPNFKQNTIAGHGYNVFKDIPLTSSPFNLDNLQHSDIGFLVPKVLTCNLQQMSSENFYILSTKQDYIAQRLRQLGIGGKIAEDRFTKDVKPGYNIREVSFNSNGCTLSATRELREFEFILNDRLELTKVFTKAVKSLPLFNESDHENVEKWVNFFNEYGTHVVKSVHGGGSIEVELSSNKPFDESVGKALFDLIKFADDLTILNANITSNTTMLKEGFSHSLTFHGGDQQYHTNDLTKLTIEDASKLLENWKKSLKFSPTVLKTEMRLLPMSEVVKKLGQNYSIEIERATSLHFNSSLKYNPPRRSKSDEADPENRENTPLMLEMLKMQQKSQERLQELMLEIKRLESQNEKRRLEINAERMAWEKRQLDMQEKFEKDRLDAANKSERDRLAWQKRMDEARIAAENEREARAKEFRDAMKEASDRADKRIRDLQDELNRQNRRPTSSCLKRGTKILMADRTEKDVESLQIGDLVLDKDMMPTTVLGVAYEFLLTQNFYGFDNSTYFFTDSHMLVGPDKEDLSNIAFYTKSTALLYYLNPLLEYLNVTDLGGPEGTNLFHLNEKLGHELEVNNVQVYKDPTNYPEDTKIYFIQVDSPSGTYFANGYVCRHEVPPVEYWPNTMSVLFNLMSNPSYLEAGKLPYTLKVLEIIDVATEEVTERVRQAFENALKPNIDDTNLESYPLMTLDTVDLNQCIGEIFGNPTLAAFGVGIYAKVGKIVAPILDGAHSNDTEIVAKLQRVLFEAVGYQLEISMKKMEESYIHQTR